MFRSLIRSTVAILAALAVAMALIVFVEVVTLAFHPLPPEFDSSDHQAMAAHVAKFPHWVLAIGLVGWGLTTFTASWIATRFGARRHPAHGIVIGSLLFLAVAFTMYMLPYPIWFELGNLITLPLATYFAVKFGRPPTSKVPISNEQSDESSRENDTT